MISWDELEELHRASQSDNEEVKAAAQQAIDVNFDGWLAEYLALPENANTKGQPWWSNFADFANHVSASLEYKPGEPNSEFRERRSRVETDRLGIILRHRKIQQAKADPSACDCDFVVLFGDTHGLGVHWCRGVLPNPHSPKQIKI